MEVLVKYYGMGWLMSAYSHETKFIIPLYFLALLRTSLRSGALSLASRTDDLVRNTKLIADFMANEHTLSNEDEVDLSCMKGYKYWLNGEEKEKVEVIPPLYQYHLKTANEVVAIDMIWNQTANSRTFASLVHRLGFSVVDLQDTPYLKAPS